MKGRKSMKEFFKSLLYVFFTQVFCWGMFILFDELVDEGLALIIGLVSLIVVLILYFVFVKKIINKNKLNSTRFNIFLIFLWILLSLLNSYIFLELVNEGVLHYCGSAGWACFLNGIEYAIYGIFLVIMSVIIIIWKIFRKIYDFFKR